MRGEVQLVGAGPGDPELLTVKALRALQQADVVVYDRLVSPAILALVPAGVARIDVGKASGHHPIPQDEINALLVQLAAAGRRVVRLKGGDPFLFGRGGEEAVALADAGIGFEVVPGITSAQGCAASLKLPLTHRSIATSVRYVTGHRRADQELSFDWAGMADPDTTLVVYMGLASIGRIAAELIGHGRSVATPVIGVSRATLANESHIVSTLGAIARDARLARLASPTLFVIGEVVSLAAALGDQSHARTTKARRTTDAAALVAAE
jgi:uroporphyrin-III C-methyltransferase